MKPSEDDIKEIAELLDCGQICFFHEPTGTIEHYSDPDSPYFDPEPWQEIMNKIDADWNNYKRFEKMDSRQAFSVMQDFANSLVNLNFQKRLFQLLSGRKPFSKFKMTVENSSYRQSWYDFKGQATIEWVRQQLT